MTIIRPNAATIKATERRDLILSCLRSTRCAMTPGQIRDWIQEHKRFSIQEKEISSHMKILLVAGKVEHPSPENTGQYKAVGR